jgi:hypothetical protein
LTLGVGIILSGTKRASGSDSCRLTCDVAISCA